MKGFTLIEIIIVVAISAFLAGLSIPRLVLFNDSQALEQTALDFKSHLEEARSYSRSSRDGGGDFADWGIAVPATNYYYIGWRDQDTENVITEVKRYYLPSNISITPYGISQQTVFGRLQSNVEEGAQSYTLERSGISVVVTVDANGNIEYEELTYEEQ